MAKLIGTAGHVDHGKTTLIKALTGIDADRLPEERARGMTIDIGFAYIDLPEVGRVSIVDVPGHERFISNMLVGALGIDVALLCVAADEGVKPQTREHLQILELLPVDKLVVTLTRSDLADEDTLSLARMEVEELLGATRFAGSVTLPVSAVTGAGLPELRAELSAKLVAAEPKRDAGAWYLPIDRVFTLKGHGCVVTGTLARGSLKVGDIAVLQPGQREVRVRSIHSHDEEVATAEPGRRTALNLGGMKAEEVHRGQVLGAEGAVFQTNCIDARVHWVGKVRHAERIRLSIGAAEVLGRAFVNKEDPSLVQLRLQEMVAAALDQPLIVRRHSPPDLLGGGKVEVPVGIPRKAVNAPRQGSSLEDQIQELVGAEPLGMATAEICRRLGRTPQELGSAFEKLLEQDLLLGFAGTWLSSDSWRSAARTMESALGELHEKNPTTSWHQRENVLKVAGLPWSGKTLDRIVSQLEDEGIVEAQGTGLRLPSFRLKLTDRQRQLLDRVKVEVEKQPVTTPGVVDLARSVFVPMPAIEEILKLGQSAGEVILLEGGVIYTSDQIEAVKSQLQELTKGRPFTASQARDWLSASRKYIIPLLEHLDRLGFTVRRGDQRIIR